ncbi:hypothetical protein TOPH_06895 [Tolypocladium ophioglossoides CBS 100239]|uniref:Cyclase n=1 Tax=Tolypocladium ophioglossoides (strain CBS 100239) TaxID=1163406 RepID=A0A0L0N3I8_TOLOC|nr:hypothetical protein TOPH_06895 [Tolypocladium ophioglossoides CBS 100239]
MDSESPPRQDPPDGSEWVWGKDDNLGRLNFLTASRVAKAAQEIKLGEVIPLKLRDFPLEYPQEPAFGREAFAYEIKNIDKDIVYDDMYRLNTQSGTHWDGFRHFAHVKSLKFYNNATGADIVGPTSNDKCSIHHWAQKGIAARGVLLDYRGYARQKNLHYDACTTYRITYDELASCGEAQGIDIRPAAKGGDIEVGDILFIRTGWVQDSKIQAEETKMNGGSGSLGNNFAGVAQEPQMVEWLHDCYFAAVAGDSPTFEAWPTSQDYFLHEYILALWGMPLGEMLDLERLSARCRDLGRWTFFFSSMPSNCIGGICSHINGMAIL